MDYLGDFFKPFSIASGKNSFFVDDWKDSSAEDFEWCYEFLTDLRFVKESLDFFIILVTTDYCKALLLLNMDLEI